MSNTPPEDSVEQRRRVLKGALAASGVATMGYSGSAFASFTCIEKTTTSAPFNGGQLVQSIPSEYATWQWVAVEVYPLNGNGSGRFNYLNYLYSVSLLKSGNSWLATGDPIQLGAAGVLSGNKITMYLLVLYAPTGSGYQPVAPSPYVPGAATTPGSGVAAQMPQPASGSCLASLNPGTAGVTGLGG